MSRNLTIIAIVFSIFLAIAILGGLVWANTLYVRSRPVEKEFLVPWLAARTFLQYGDNPYGEPATQRAQIVYYGRLAAGGQDTLNLWLPFPLELLYFPFALVTDYAVARALWMTCLEIALVALGFLSLRLTGWKPARTLLPLVLLFPLAWVYGVFSISSGSGIGFIALALAGFLISIRDKNDELAGALLFLLACAPRITGVFLILLLWWIIATRRWRIFWGFLMVTGLLLLLSFFLLPDWFVPFLQGQLYHIAYNPGFSSWGIFASWSPVVGLRLGWALTGGLLLLLFIEWGITLRQDFRHFLWAVCLTMAVTPLLGIPLAPTDLAVLFVPLVLFVTVLNERWSRPRRWGPAGLTLVLFFAGLWLITAILSVPGASASQADFLVLFLPLLLIAGLYWMRWWAIRPPLIESEDTR